MQRMPDTVERKAVDELLVRVGWVCVYERLPPYYTVSLKATNERVISAIIQSITQNENDYERSTPTCGVHTKQQAKNVTVVLFVSVSPLLNGTFYLYLLFSSASMKMSNFLARYTLANNFEYRPIDKRRQRRAHTHTCTQYV